MTLYGVSVVKSVSLVKGHSISFAPMTGKVSGIYFGVRVSKNPPKNDSNPLLFHSCVSGLGRF